MDKKISRLAELIGNRVDELKGVKTQIEISAEVGYTSHNMLTMVKQGKAKVAIERAVPLANALDLDPKTVCIMALEQFHDPKVVAEFVAALTGEFSASEMQLILALRQAETRRNPVYSDAKIQAAVKALV